MRTTNHILTQDEIVRCLLNFRIRLTASVWLVVRDSHLCEDVFQDVMVKALARHEQFESEQRLHAWARTTARNAAINLVRKLSKGWKTMDDELLAILDDEWEEESSDTVDRMAALADCVRSLPEPSRVILNMRYQDGRSCTETAAAIGLEVNATYKRLSRLHTLLRECVEKRIISTRVDR